jgi:hypothetical protein
MKEDCHVPKCGHDIAEGTLLAMTLTRSMFFPIEQQLFSVVESLAMVAGLAICAPCGQPA